MAFRRFTKPVAAAIAAAAIAGGTYGIVSATAANTSSAATTVARQQLPGRTGSNARSGPAAGGSVGTVTSVSSSGFTLTTSAGQKVTVTNAGSAAVKRGEVVLVLGTTNGTAIAARHVIVKPATASKPAAKVVPFQPGAPSASKQVGQVPASYQQGAGTIVSGTTADNATKAALAAYPGGIVDRVVKLSNGEYEVHNIGVNWPHHIFVSKTFKVVGAN
jgi:hypothetical protein